MSLASQISARRLGRARSRVGFDSLLEALESAIDGDHDPETLRSLSLRLKQLQAKADRKAAAAEQAKSVMPVHVTLSTKFEGDALQTSIDMKAMYQAFGCTVYNPNRAREDGDCPDDGKAGSSNWLRYFIEHGLKRSHASRGFIAQLQATRQREKSDMQIAEEGMGSDILREGVPIIGVWNPALHNVVKSLEVNHLQWEAQAAGQTFSTTALNAEDFEITDECMVRWFGRLAKGALPHLEILALNGGNTIGDAGITALAEACSAKGAMAQLQQLWLQGNQIGDAGMEALAKAAADGALSSCHKLYLYSNQIGDAGVEALAKACAGGAMANITDLFLAGNQIGDGSCSALADAAAKGAMAQLQELGLSGNQIGDAGVQALASVAADDAMAHLEKLNLFGNQIGDAAAAADGALPQLTEVQLGFNQIGDAGVSALASACASGALSGIEYIELSGNPASDAAQQAVDDIIESRQ